MLCMKYDVLSIISFLRNMITKVYKMYRLKCAFASLPFAGLSKSSAGTKQRLSVPIKRISLRLQKFSSRVYHLSVVLVKRKLRTDGIKGSFHLPWQVNLLGHIYNATRFYQAFVVQAIFFECLVYTIVKFN